MNFHRRLPKNALLKKHMPKNLRVTHRSKMPKILKPKVKKLQSKVAYHHDVSGNSLVAISVMLRNPTARLEMDNEDDK
jgi:hypothetical protein